MVLALMPFSLPIDSLPGSVLVTFAIALWIVLDGFHRYLPNFCTAFDRLLERKMRAIGKKRT
jgi:hypothetical protein